MNVPVSIDYEYVKKLESENERLKENERLAKNRIKEVYEKLYRLEQELDLFHLLFSYLIHSGSLFVGAYYKVFSIIFDPNDKFFKDVLRDKGRYSLEKDLDGLRVIDRWQR